LSGLFSAILCASIVHSVMHTHSQAQVHVWVIGLLLQPDHDFGTISQLKSVGLICRWTHSTKNWKRICFFEAPALSDCCFRHCVQINLLTYIWTDL